MTGFAEKLLNPESTAAKPQSGRFSDALLGGAEPAGDLPSSVTELSRPEFSARPDPTRGQAVETIQSAAQDAFNKARGRGRTPADPQRIEAELIPAEQAGFATQAIASLPTDFKARLEFFARQRFPSEPLSMSLDRFGTTEDGRIFFQDPETGRFIQEEGEFGISEGVLPTVERNVNAVGASAGPLIQNIGGTGGGLAGAAMGTSGGPAGTVAGSVGGAAVGGSLADGVRQFLANKLTGEDKSLTARILQAGAAGSEEAVAELLGRAGAGVFKRAVDTLPSGLRFGQKAAFDVGPTAVATEKAARVSDPANPIRLTPGEATDNPALLRRQFILSQTDGSDETISQFYQIRNEAVRDAVDRLLGNISYLDSVDVMTKLAVEGAQKAVGVERRKLQAAAKPFYDEAFEVTNVDVSDALGLIDDKILRGGLTGKTRARVLNWRKELTTAEGEPRPVRVELIDSIKKEMDTAINKAGETESSVDAGLVHHVTEIRDMLVGAADAVSPVYKTARDIYTPGIGTALDLERGITGSVASLTGNRTLRAARTIMSPTLSSVGEIRRAKNAFAQAEAMDEWDAAIRAYLQDVFESIPESSVGQITNLGGVFRKAVFGSKKKREMLRAALDHTPAAGLIDDMMDTLEATGKAMKGQSLTAFFLKAQEQFARENTPFVAEVVDTIEFWKTPGRLANWIRGIAQRRYSRQMADILTSPDGIERLRELRKLGPRTEAGILGLAHMLVTSRINAAERERRGASLPGTAETDRRGRPQEPVPFLPEADRRGER